MRVNIKGHPDRAARLQLERGNAAVDGRSIVLQARGHVNDLGLDVFRDVHQRVGIESLIREARKRAADRDVERRRSGNAGAGRRLAASGQPQPVAAEAVDQPSQQGEGLIGAELIGREVDPSVGVFGDQLNAIVGTRFDPRMGAQADRDVQRLRPRVKEIQRPDVYGATRQINSCRSRC